MTTDTLPPLTTTAVSVQNVSRGYGAVRALDGLDLSVAAGETVALLGANGAGKSTLVHLMLGLLTPDSGQIQVLDGPPARAVAQGRIGVMLQDAGLMPGVRVRDLLQLVRGRYQDPRPLGQLLDEADLTSLAERRVDRLSGGQTQRVRFAVAIAGNPDVLVLDEPTVAMDVESRRAFWAVIHHYAADGHAVLFATHYLTEADEFADRIIVLAAGRVVAEGTPAEVKATVGGSTVRFTLDGESCAGLDALPGVSAVEVRGRTATLRTDDAERTVRALLAARDRVPNLEVSGAGLEDALLALTVRP